MTKIRTVLAKILCVKNTVIQNFSLEENSVFGQPVVYVDVRPYKRYSHICSHCGRQCTCYDHGAD